MVEKKKTAASKAPKASAPRAAKVVKSTAEVSPESSRHRRMLVGVVVSDKMQKTIVVKVDRRVRHALYKKYVVKSERYKAHDESNAAKVGDRVQIIESRPLSREKRWALRSILRKAVIHTVDANI